MDRIPVKTPQNIEELVQCLGKATEKCKLVAGGTDFIISMHKKHRDCDMLVDLSGIKELKSVYLDNQTLVIGAGATFTEIHKNQLVRTHAVCLAEAASMVGSTQIRNRATIGGNIANTSPAADSIPALLALDASIELVDGKGRSLEKPLSELLSVKNGPLLKHDEAIVGIRIPLHAQQHNSAFAKLGSRSAVTISKISLAVLLACGTDNEITDARISLGSVGKTAYRPEAVERKLIGRILEAELGDFLGAELSKEIESSLKGRSSMPYKKEAVMGLAHDVIAKLI